MGSIPYIMHITKLKQLVVLSIVVSALRRSRRRPRRRQFERQEKITNRQRAAHARLLVFFSCRSNG